MDTAMITPDDGRRYTSSRETRGIGAALAFAVLTGVIAPITHRWPIALVPPALMAFLTVFVAFLCLAPFGIYFYLKKPQLPDLPKTAVAGMVMHGLVPYLYSVAMFSVSMPQMVMAYAFCPLFVILLVLVAKTEVMTIPKVSGAVLAVVGLALTVADQAVESPGEGSLSGFLIMLASAFFHALYTANARPLVKKTHFIVFTTLIMGFGSLFLLIACLASGILHHVLDLGFSEWAGVFLNSVFSHCLAFSLFTYAIMRTTPLRVETSVTTSSVIVPLFSVIFWNRFLDWSDFVGILVTLLGIWLTYTSSLDTKKRAAVKNADHTPPEQ